MAFPGAFIFPAEFVVLVLGFQCLSVGQAVDDREDFFEVPVLFLCQFQVFFELGGETGCRISYFECRPQFLHAGILWRIRVV